jgi:putative membrane protein
MQTFRLIAAVVSAAFLAAGAPQALAQQDKDKSNKQDKSYKQDKSSKLSKQDAQSMQKLAEADRAEVAAGKMAQQKASSEQVKKFAEHMVQDHGKMLDEKQEMAQSKGVKLPQSPDKKHQAAMKKLQDASGTEFDRQYMAQMVKDHEKALKLAQKAAKDAKDPQLKAAAQKGAQEIEEHLKNAKQLHASLESSGKGRSSQGSSSQGSNSKAKESKSSK